MNSQLVARSGDFMRGRRLANAYLMEAKYALLRMVRNPAFSIPTLAFPLFFYLLIGYLFGAFRNTNATVDVPLYLFCGFATMAAMTPGMFGFGIGLALEREQGLFTMKRALPIPPFASLFGSVAMSMLSTLAATLLLAIAAYSLGLISLPFPKLLAVLAIIALGAIPFSAIGLWIGSLTSGRAAPAVANIVYLLLTYFSGLFIPLPESLRLVPLASPAFYLDQLALEAAGARSILIGGALNHVVALIAATVLFLGLAARRLERVG